MKRWIKNTRTVALCLIPIGLVVGFSNSWSSKVPISCVGSSAVKPFMESLAQDYMKTNKKVDITVEAGGSGFGIQQIAEGFANIGNASKDSYSAVRGEDDGKDGFRDPWTKNRIKTVTIGWEAICMVFIPPKELNVNQDVLNKMLVVNDTTNTTAVDSSNIYELMRVFSGINDPNHPVNNPTLYDFYNSDISLNSSQQELLKNTPVVPYVRAGGSLTSGTAASFYNNTNFENFNSSLLSKDQQNALVDGSYGHRGGGQPQYDYDGFTETDEANSRAWDIFSKNNQPGAMVYLSSGFVAQNADLIKSKGYGIMAYGSNATPYDLDKVDIDGGYNWFRPLNVMLKTPDTDTMTPESDFIGTILSPQYAELLARNGAKQLDRSKELNQIFPDLDGSNLGTWYSDYELAEKSEDWEENGPWSKSYHFAPIPKILLPDQKITVN